MNFGMTCPECGGNMEPVGVFEQGVQCDTCGFKYDALGIRTNQKWRNITMKMNDVYSKPMKEVLENDCDVVEQKTHTDNDGNVIAIEVKYRPKDAMGKNKTVEIPEFMQNGGRR